MVRPRARPAVKHAKGGKDAAGRSKGPSAARSLTAGSQRLGAPKRRVSSALSHHLSASAAAAACMQGRASSSHRPPLTALTRLLSRARPWTQAGSCALRTLAPQGRRDLRGDKRGDRLHRPGTIGSKTMLPAQDLLVWVWAVKAQALPGALCSGPRLCVCPALLQLLRPRGVRPAGQATLSGAPLWRRGQGRARLGAVQRPVDVGRDRLDLGAQLLLDAVQGVPVLVRDQVDCQPQVAKAARPVPTGA